MKSILAGLAGGGCVLLVYAFFGGQLSLVFNSLLPSSGQSTDVAASSIQSTEKAFLTPVKNAFVLGKYSLARADGTNLKINDISKGYTLINLWASYCRPCRVEMPSLARLKREFNDKDLQIVTINLEDISFEHVKLVLNEWQASVLPPYKDYKNTLKDNIAQKGIPYTLLIDPKGEVIADHLGTIDWDDENVRQTLNEMIHRH